VLTEKIQAMKKLLLLILATVATIDLKGQANYINVCVDCGNLHHSFDFNSPADSTNYFFLIDTSQSSNLWQLGTPSKNVFNSGYGGPKAFVTDTLNPYPINNSSSFQFSMVNCSWMTQGPCGGYEGLGITIITKINSDSTKDGGTIEVSHNGTPWVNLINDPLASTTGDIYSANDTIQSSSKPGYSGIANNWKQISVNFSPEMVNPSDTISLRFSFSSDSIQTNKDGWMIGLIQMGGFFEGIEEIQNDNLISISPNPSSDELRIHATKVSSNQKVQILNCAGQILYDNSNFTGETIDVSQFTDGIYLLKYSDKKNLSIKKLVVEH
jgi:hypothetical protein